MMLEVVSPTATISPRVSLDVWSSAFAFSQNFTESTLPR